MRISTTLLATALLLLSLPGCSRKENRPVDPAPKAPAPAPVRCPSIDSILHLPDPGAALNALKLSDDSCGLKALDALLGQNRFDLLDRLRIDGATSEHLGVAVFERLQTCDPQLIDYIARTPGSQLATLATFELRLALPDSVRNIGRKELASLVPASCLERHGRTFDMLAAEANRLDR